MFTPLRLLQVALRSVPAVRYAVGVGGIGAVVAIYAGFRIDYRVAVIGTTIILGLMFVLAVFAGQVSRRPVMPGQAPVALFITWAFAILTTAAPALLVSSTFFSWPQPLSQLFALNVPVAAPVIGGMSSVNVNGAGPIFALPKLSGRTIDACIISVQFSELGGQQCSRSAQIQIVAAFCQLAGYSSLTNNFSWKDTGIVQSSYKFIQEKGSDGKLISRWSKDDRGGAIFTYIECDNK